MLTPAQEQSLTSAGDCFDHYHSSDRGVTHDTLNQISQAARVASPQLPYVLSRQDDIVVLPAGGVIILPPARNGGEFQVIMSGTAKITVQLSGTDLIYGESSVELTVKGTSLHFKAITGGWVLL